MKPWKLFAAMVVLVIGAQLLAMGLAALRPPPPIARLADPSAFARLAAPSLGASDPDVVVFVLSDYNCPNCRAMHADLRALVAGDRRVRLVYRDWPVLGARSRRAARLAIASAAQDRHAAFDDELMRRGGPLDEASLRAAAARAEVDWPRLTADLARDSATIDALLADTAAQADALGFAGTPVLVIGPYVVTGRTALKRLNELVAKARGVGAG